MQRYVRPGWFTVHVINPLVRWAGLASTLDVARRVSGTTQRVPVNVLELNGDRYLVAVRGHTQWVWNLRAAGHCAVRRHLRRVRYQATELPVAERPAVIAAYRARWHQVGPFFEQLPDPADHPVFRLEAAAPVTRPASTRSSAA
jgi:hypothetical protein